jgi:hypothetical protein
MVSPSPEVRVRKELELCFHILLPVVCLSLDEGQTTVFYSQAGFNLIAVLPAHEKHRGGAPITFPSCVQKKIAANSGAG